MHIFNSYIHTETFSRSKTVTSHNNVSLKSPSSKLSCLSPNRLHKDVIWPNLYNEFWAHIDWPSQLLAGHSRAGQRRNDQRRNARVSNLVIRVVFIVMACHNQIYRSIILSQLGPLAIRWTFDRQRPGRAATVYRQPRRRLLHLVRLHLSSSPFFGPAIFTPTWAKQKMNDRKTLEVGWVSENDGKSNSARVPLARKWPSTLVGNKKVY